MHVSTVFQGEPVTNLPGLRERKKKNEGRTNRKEDSLEGEEGRKKETIEQIYNIFLAELRTSQLSEKERTKWRREGRKVRRNVEQIVCCHMTTYFFRYVQCVLIVTYVVKLTFVFRDFRLKHFHAENWRLEKKIPEKVIHLRCKCFT